MAQLLERLPPAAVIRFVGPEGLFGPAAVIAAMVGVFAIYRMTRRPSVSEEGSTEFSVLPRTTPIAFEMDLRSDKQHSKCELAPAMIKVCFGAAQAN